MLIININKYIILFNIYNSFKIKYLYKSQKLIVQIKSNLKFLFYQLF